MPQDPLLCGAAQPDTQAQRRFSGLDRLYGPGPAQSVRSAHVVVVGVGGVGSWAAEALARSGVGRITLIDMDHVSESNINRQIHAITPTLGMAKITAMAERIALINPDCHVQGVDAFVDADNWLQLLPEGADAVIDACDQVIAKTAMAQWARQTGRQFITVGAAGGKRQAQAVTICDLSSCTHDPLLAQVRYRLRKFHGAPKEGKKMGVACVSSTEPVASAQGTAQGDNTLNCHGYGSLVTVTATFGLCAAGWVMDKLSRGVTIARKTTL